MNNIDKQIINQLNATNSNFIKINIKTIFNLLLFAIADIFSGFWILGINIKKSGIKKGKYKK